MLLDNVCGSALDKRLVSQLVFNCSQFRLRLCNFLVESYAFDLAIVPVYFNPNLPQPTYPNETCSQNWCAELNGFGVKKSRKSWNLFFNTGNDWFDAELRFLVRRDSGFGPQISACLDTIVERRNQL